MIATYANDREAGPGNGLLLIAQSGLGPGPLGVAIQRSSDHAFLAAGGVEWKSQKSFMQLSAAQAGNDLAIALNPDLTGQLATTETYRVILQDSQGCESAAILRIGEIIYSLAPKADNAPMAQGAAAENPQPAGPQEQKPGKPAAEPAEIELLPPLAAGVPETPSGQSRDAVKKGRGASFWLMAALIAIGCALLGLFLHSSRQAAQPGADNPVTTGARAEPGAVAEELVRRFFAQGRPDGGEGAMALAARIPAGNAAEQDALYRLYYYAAGQGNPRGLLSYGQALDPSRPQWGSIQKDAVLAWQSYAAAQAKGSRNEAGEAMRRMSAWLEEEAARGSAAAASWLARLPKKQFSGQP